MTSGGNILADLAIVLCVAAVTTVLCHRLRQPLVLGYIIAGLIIGPHVPLPLVADQGNVDALSELGVILLMFHLGLEFNLKKIMGLGLSAFIVIIEASFVTWTVFMAARIFGWGLTESYCMAAAVASSSTAIVIMYFDEKQIGGKLRQTVLGVLVAEDMLAIILLAVIAGISSGGAPSAALLGGTATRLLAFLVVFMMIGLAAVPRAMRSVVRMGRPETTMIAGVGFAFAAGILAGQLGYPSALGAFLAGSVMSQSGEGRRISALVRPIRDLFASVFFVAIGMTLDPAMLGTHLPEAVGFTAVFFAAKFIGVSSGALLTGTDLRTSIRAGLSLNQLGEFSFLIAATSLKSGSVEEYVYPVIISVAALSTFLCPHLIRFSGPIADWGIGRFPKPVHMFATLYASWVEVLGGAFRLRALSPRVKMVAGFLLGDAAMLAGVMIGFFFAHGWIKSFAVRSVGLSPTAADAIVVASSVAAGLPFCIGIFNCSRHIGHALALHALPLVRNGDVDFARSPRKVFITALQMAALASVGLPLMALAQFIFPGFPWILFMLTAAVFFAVAFHRSVSDLQKHVRAGARVLYYALGDSAAGSPASGLEQVHDLLPGIGEFSAVEISEKSPAISKSISELNIHGLTGASVLVLLRRDERSVIIPTGTERLKAGDTLLLTGSSEAVTEAGRMLDRPADGKKDAAF